MSGNLMGFDARKVEPVSFETLPPGDYTVVIVKSETKPTKDGTGQRLNLELQVVDGQYKGRKLFDGINIANKSAQCQQIGQGTLSAICRAVNVLTPKDSSELHNKPLIAVVKTGKDNNNNDRSEVKSYKPVGLYETPSKMCIKQPSLVEQAFEKTEQPAAATGKKSPWE